MGNLRTSIIRLAHARPELRPALLPLLKEAAAQAPDAAAFERTTKNLSSEIQALVGWCEEHPGALPPPSILKYTQSTNGAVAQLLERTAAQLEELRKLTEEVDGALKEQDPTRFARRLERVYLSIGW